MNPTIEQLLTAISSLSEEDRHELIERLISSEDPSQVAIDDELLAIIERRSEEIDSGRVQTVSWDEVRRKAREAIGG